MYKKDPSSADYGFAMPKWLASMKCFQGQRAFILTVFDYILDICSGQQQSWKLLARKDRQIELLNDRIKGALQEVQNSNQEVRRIRFDYQSKKRALLELSDNSNAANSALQQINSTNTSQPLKNLNDLRRQHKIENQFRSSIINTTIPSQFSVMGSLTGTINNTKSQGKVSSACENSINSNNNNNISNNNAPNIKTQNAIKLKTSEASNNNSSSSNLAHHSHKQAQPPTVKQVNLMKRPSAVIVHNPSALKRQFSAQLKTLNTQNNQNYSSRSSSIASELMQKIRSTDQYQAGEEEFKQQNPIRSNTIDMIITSQHQRQHSLTSSSKFTPSAVTSPTPTKSNVFNRLVPAAPQLNPKRTNPVSSFSGSSNFEMQQYPDDNKWVCRGTISDAHPSAVCSLVNFENLLFSSSNKFFKVWNIDSLKQISEVEAHTSLIKAVRIWPQQKMFITACDKIISLWDLFSLKCIGSLKGHRDQVRSITTKGHQLFSAGKSEAKKGDDSSGSAALLVWDIRMTKCLVQEKQPNQDIFSLQIAQSPYDNRSELYAATRNHSVLRYDISQSNDYNEQMPVQKKSFNMKPQGQLMPQHYDAVTSLALMKDNLVSGSRDGHLRVWNLWDSLQKGPQKIQLAKKAHQDWINTLATNNKGDLLYSGCRQGVVRVWRKAKNKLRCRACIHAHPQSISDICAIPDFGSGLETFITGSVDRSIRIFRVKKSHKNFLSQSIQDEYQSIQDSPN